MSKITAVLFDYGMVLSGPPLPSAWERMKTITALDEPRFHAAYWAPRHPYDRGTYTGEEYWSTVGSHAGLTLNETQIEGLIEADIDLWTELNTPMIAWVQELQRAGIRTGILSNIGDHMTRGIRAKFDWVNAFDHCTWSYTLKLAKPELEIYRHAAEGLRTPPAEILFLDDREENIAAALQSGMQAIRYTTHDAFLKEMNHRGLDWLLHPAVTR